MTAARALAVCLLALMPAQSVAANPSDNVGAADVGSAPDVGAPTSSTDTSQVPASGGSAVDAGQISPTRSAAAAPPAQLSSAAPTAEAPRAPSTVSQGRNPNLAPVKGADRCDPAAGQNANQPACAHILDSQADRFTDGATAPDVPAAPTDASPSGLVNDVVNGGTGTVVPLPPK